MVLECSHSAKRFDLPTGTGSVHLSDTAIHSSSHSNQAFFAHRVHAVSGQLPIPVFCWIVLFLRFVAIIILGIAAFLMTDLVQFTTQWRWGFYFVLIASAVVDVTIAVSLCYYLIQKRSEVMQR